VSHTLAIFLIVLTSVSCNGSSEHVHAGFEIPDGEAVPSVQLVATADALSGWNLHVITTDFAFAPQRAGREFVLGEGHAHLYVDGEKRDRLYGPWYHLADLTPGLHTIDVTLNSNDHAEYQVGGKAIADQVTVEVVDDHPSHGAEEPLQADPGMSVAIRLDEDSVGGWNLFIETAGFIWAPEQAGSDPAESEGHAHLSIDGVKVARVYGPAVYLSSLDPGLHTVSVSLHGNNHAPYVIDDEPVAAALTLEVAGEALEPQQTISIEVEGGAVVGGVRRAEVSRGDVIEILVRTDSSDSVHLHGYDLNATVDQDKPAVLTFAANIPGVFDVELEESGLLILELTVR
jgi:hypothetical protein